MWMERHGPGEFKIISPRRRQRRESERQNTADHIVKFTSSMFGRHLLYMFFSSSMLWTLKRTVKCRINLIIMLVLSLKCAYSIVSKDGWA